MLCMEVVFRFKEAWFKFVIKLALFFSFHKSNEIDMLKKQGVGHQICFKVVANFL
jgi:hypothetical protein